jgi:aspartate-semialdehyde dehydrogenase
VRDIQACLQTETRLLLGRIEAGKRHPAGMSISAQTNRVPVVDGHTLSIALKLDRSVYVEDVLGVYNDYRGPQDVKNLPSAPEVPILVRKEPDRPQPRRDRDSSVGMSVTVGRIRPCPILDFRLVSVVHNTLRGAASGSIFNAELLVSKGYQH